MQTGAVVTSTDNIMAQIKNLIENVCDLYEHGVEPEAIAFGLEIKSKLVTDILADYSEIYQEDQEILRQFEDIERYKEFG